MFLVIALVCALLAVPDRDGDLLRAIRILTGAADTEELDEGEMERFAALAARPLRLNGASRSRLVSSGLFSPYQAASLEDYRSRNGDILSFAELGQVDGFNEESAGALRFFVSLEPSLPPGALPGEARRMGEGRISADWVQKTDGDAEGQGFRYGLKFRYTKEDRWALAVAARNAWGERLFPPSSRTGYFVWQLPSQRGKLILGSFHARFGQGLTRWSGFTLSELSSVRSFTRRPTLLTPAWTFSGSSCLLGVAGDVRLGGVQLSAYATLPRGGDFETGANIGRAGRYGQFGVTLTARRAGGAWQGMNASLDGRYHYRGADLFGELALRLPERSLAWRGGLQFPLADGVTGGLLVRAVPSAFAQKKNGEYALAAGLDFGLGPYVMLDGKSGFGSARRRHTGSVTAEGSALPVPLSEPGRKRLKINATWTAQLNGTWSATLRLTERFQNFDSRNRTGIRLDLQRETGPWTFRFRAESVASLSWAVLGYAEGGWQHGKGWLWLRATLFRADHWDDRIYCYQRGAPGSFNVTACYGRGYMLSAVAALKSRRWGNGYLRAGWTGYFPGQEKPGKTELYLVGIFSF